MGWFIHNTTRNATNDMKNTKATVKMLLDILSEIKDIPTTPYGSIDMVKWGELPEVKSVITLIKAIGGEKHLHKFPIATMLLAGMFRDETNLPTAKCDLCGEQYVGYGNNAQPLSDGRCCDKCNNDVIMARLKRTLK